MFAAIVDATTVKLCDFSIFIVKLKREGDAAAQVFVASIRDRMPKSFRSRPNFSARFLLPCFGGRRRPSVRSTEADLEPVDHFAIGENSLLQVVERVGRLFQSAGGNNRATLAEHVRDPRLPIGRAVSSEFAAGWPPRSCRPSWPTPSIREQLDRVAEAGFL